METASASTKTVLALGLSTDPAWAHAARGSLGAILSDHAWCEQKAASSCISLIQLHSDKATLVDALSPIVTEEWGHFRLVVAELRRRGLPLLPQRKDEYVAGLLAHVQKGGSPEGRLLDGLLMMAMIEARSCERFRLLSEALEDEGLQAFYRRFMESEAGHYTMLITLAEHYVPREKVRSRWDEWRKYETQLLQSLPLRSDRMH